MEAQNELESFPAAKSLSLLRASDEDSVIRTAFIEFCDQVLLPVVKEMILGLKNYIRNNPRKNLRYVEGALKKLEEFILYYDVVAKDLQDPQKATLNEFLNLMGVVDAGLHGFNNYDVSCGMKDAGLIEKYREFFAIVEFRCSKAIALITGIGGCVGIDNLSVRNSHSRAVKAALKEKVASTVERPSDTELCELLNEYWANILHGGFLGLWNGYCEAALGRGKFPYLLVDYPLVSFGDYNRSLDFLSLWKDRFVEFESGLGEEIRDNPDFQRDRRKLIADIDHLTTNLERLKIRSRARRAVFLDDDPGEKD